jgi:hypothetical protein
MWRSDFRIPSSLVVAPPPWGLANLSLGRRTSASSRNSRPALCSQIQYLISSYQPIQEASSNFETTY